MQIIEPVISTPTFAFPSLYITVPQASMGDDEPRDTVYPLEAAPIDVFNAWLDMVLDSETDVGGALFFMTIHAHRDSWDITERWWVINALALYGVDLSKYYFESREAAEKAVKAREVQ